MKPGGLFTAIGALIVLGGLVWWFNKHPTVDAKKTPDAPKLISVDAKQIEEYGYIRLKLDDDGELALAPGKFFQTGKHKIDQCDGRLTLLSFE